MAYHVKIDVSPIYEMLNSFLVYVTKKWIQHLDIGPEWILDVERKLSSNVRAALAPAATWPFDDFDVLFAWAAYKNTTLENQDFLDMLTELSADELFARVSSLMPSLTIEESTRIRNSYVPLLRLWDQHYCRNISEDHRVWLEEDAEEKRILLEKMGPELLIEYATAGVIVEPIAGLNEVILFPTVHNRPINMYCFYEGMMIIQYPVDIPEESEDEPPTCLLRFTHALADPERLRLLRYVSDEPKSLSEMCEELGKEQDPVKDQVTALRIAGLLRTHLLGSNRKEKYSIRPDGVSELNMFLESYIRI
ncbi:helix-turn-helix domain-containing protein [Paenibacillus polysaccharolyticus]|uniref:Helix-turn-helix domain-containing protein n=2 Tax=Paenibacillus TaxID=44249 RepID=A0A1G5DYM6_9BACL|nr:MULTISPECIES: helix-turn-helix domain-containing protein [Paenibacillus]MBY0204873.1 helix-turn-helix transcriptional regulator [Paenibacillus cucumis (ex Kampfer et al. 2016)]MCP1133467.1 helix-turn-helix domain-containing protein [Paenibacillus polysaccharolyticus]SCY19531.1 Helix-turn-helix domain-containing protein [Paenibacillus polysaccharolyticus]